MTDPYEDAIPAERPAEPPAPYVRKIGPDDQWASVHIRDDLEESAQTLCGRSLEDIDLEGWASLPMDRKSCESCLRVRTDREEKRKREEAAESGIPYAPAS